MKDMPLTDHVIEVMNCLPAYLQTSTIPWPYHTIPYRTAVAGSSSLLQHAYPPPFKTQFSDSTRSYENGIRKIACLQIR